jgi:cyclophilin family peptidyl-prolyl cis-trans isomerase
LETLEQRNLLTVAPTLTPIQDVVLSANAPLNIALDGFDQDGGPLTYTATVSNATGTLNTFIPQGNRSLRISVQNFGDMTLQLFEDLTPRTTARIIELANSDFYDGLIFHRIIDGFMVQGGDPTGTGTGGSGVDFDDEFDSDLQFTSAGVLAMANSGDDTNDSQFFITDAATRWLDFNHSIFGFLVEGDSALGQISAVAVDDNDKPLTDVVIESMEVFYDYENAVLRLSSPEGTMGTADVTVTVTDNEGLTAQQTFHVSILPDDTNSPPYLLGIPDAHTTIDQPVTFQLPSFDVEGDAVHYDGIVSPTNANLAMQLDGTTGQVTVTPSGGIVGVHGLYVGVQSASGGAWDTQSVPVMIHPNAPTGVTLLASVDPDGDEITGANNTVGNELRFQVTGLLSGMLVEVFANGTKIGQGTSAGSDLVVVSDGLTRLPDGAYQITARQTLADQAVNIGNRTDHVDLSSGLSAPLGIVVDAVTPAFTSTPVDRVVAGVPYAYNVETNEEPDGDVQYSLTASPEGMTINAATGLIAWTPQSSQAPSQSVVVRAADAAGNIVTQAFTIQFDEPPEIDPIGDRTVAEGSLLSFTVSATDADMPLVFGLEPGAPSGATIHQDSGLFQWSPSEAQGPGNYDITVRVADARGFSATQTFTVTVTEVNQPPVLQPIAPQWTVDEGELLEFTAAANDADLPAGSLAYSLGEGAPAGASIDPATGVFSWRPSELQGGASYTIELRVADAAGASDSATFQVDVTETDQPPAFAAIDTQTVPPGEDLIVQVRATDPDSPANAIRYSLEPGAPAGAAVDTDTGLLTWSVPEEFPLDSVDIGVRATEIGPGGADGLSSVALVRVVTSAIRGELLGSLADKIVKVPFVSSSGIAVPLGGGLRPALLAGASDLQFQFLPINIVVPTGGLFHDFLSGYDGSSGGDRSVQAMKPLTDEGNPGNGGAEGEGTAPDQSDYRPQQPSANDAAIRELDALVEELAEART